MSERRYIDLAGLGEFKELMAREVDQKLKHSVAGRVRVLHNRMISYYSPPGEVYSVVKRLRIPRVKPGDSFCLKGILPDEYSEREFMNGTVIHTDCKILNPSSRENTRELTSRYLDFDAESRIVTAKNELKNVIESDSGVVLLVETRLKNIRPGGICRVHGGFNRGGVLVAMEEDCVRPLKPVLINGSRQSNFSVDSEPQYGMFFTVELDKLKARGVEVQKLKCCTRRPISPYGPENGYQREEDREERICNNPEKYKKHLERYSRSEKYCWRWVGCKEKLPESGFVRLRTRRGGIVTPWIVYQLNAPSKSAQISREPARIRL